MSRGPRQSGVVKLAQSHTGTLQGFAPCRLRLSADEYFNFKTEHICSKKKGKESSGFDRS
ncbi:hypothetical protein PISMIDRAFT_672381 [Pisolithus microcarpus 441]|uniref:Uncharacterized protein n=1 Tax=Pisolithus microcarpus 441 TaxID=765257 RepID=A0A0C9YX04_9AGAM|nr:hypothetical protein PISMIDRAFT_672381 [Pisolithus microcarpus 441]